MIMSVNVTKILQTTLIGMFLVGGLSTGHAAQADKTDKSFTEGLALSVGLEYYSGDYGTAYTTDTWSIPLGLSYYKDNFFTGASTSFISAKSDGSIIVSSSSAHKRMVTTSSTTSSASGIGDLELYAGYELPAEGKTRYSVTGRLKLPTADENDGLGSGETDYAAEVSMLHKLEGATRLFASLGYQISGDSAATDYDNVFYANAGISYAHQQGQRLGVMLDYAQAATPGFDDALEVTGFMNMELADKRSLYFFALLGLTDGSPDYGAGISYQYSY